MSAEATMARAIRINRIGAGVEARFQSGAVTWGAVLLIVGFTVVVGIIAWGLLG